MTKFPHECAEDRICTCSVTALEPDEDCSVHGVGEYRPRCGKCGRFLKRDPEPDADMGRMEHDERGDA